LGARVIEAIIDPLGMLLEGSHDLLLVNFEVKYVLKGHELILIQKKSHRYLLDL